MPEKFIQKAIKHPGALHRQLGVPKGEKIPAEKLASAAKKGGKLGQRARFAQTLKKLHEDDSMREAFSPEDVAKRSLTAKRELDSASRSKTAKSMLDKAAADKKSRMHEDFSPISDAITLIANQEYSDATNVFNDVLGGRVLSALETHKEMIAKSLFVPSADTFSEEHARDEKHGVFYADEDEAGTHHVFHSETGKSHASFSNKHEAEAHAKEMNKASKYAKKNS